VVLAVLLYLAILFLLIYFVDRLAARTPAED